MVEFPELIFRGSTSGVQKIGLVPLIAVSFWPAPIAAQEQATDIEVNRTELDPIVDGYVEQGLLPVLYVRIEDRTGRIVYERTAQSAILVPGDKIDGDSWFRIWSMSKIVTISAALDMVEDGLLRFDDPVTSYIPEFRNLQVAVDGAGQSLARSAYAAPKVDAAEPCALQTVPVQREMTVRDLLNHTAGFYYFTAQPCLNAALEEGNLAHANDSQALIESLAKLPLIQQPGEGYFYGFNTSVLGLVMERASDRSLAQIVEERITGPLNISGLQYGQTDGVALLPRFGGREGRLQEVPASQLDIFVASPPDYAPDQPLYLGGEGMLGTASAYADFLQMLLGRGEANGVRILDEETIELLTAAHTQLDNEYGHNGFNLWVNSGLLGDGTMGVGGLWIGGGYEGTYFWVDQQRGLVGVIMTQVNRPPEGADQKNDVIREAFYAALSRPIAE